MSADRINARVLAGIKRAGAKTGAGALFGTVTRKVATDDTVYPPVMGVSETYACTLIWDTFSVMARAQDGVEAGDVKAIIPATSITTVPAVGDSLTVGSETWQIKNVDTLRPGGVGILYTCHCGT